MTGDNEAVKEGVGRWCNRSAHNVLDGLKCGSGKQTMICTEEYDLSSRGN